MAKRVVTAAVVGIDAVPITVEADIANGLPRVFIVGLPDTAVSEAQERVRAAIRNTPGVDFPLQRITVNLAPADLRKEGSGFDLAIAVAVLAARGDVPVPDETTCLIGELSLEGRLRPTNGILPIVAGLRSHGVSDFIVAPMNAAEASLVRGITVYPAKTLHDVLFHLRGRKLLAVFAGEPAAAGVTDEPLYDLRDVVGHAQAKRCLEIAAAGGHNLLFSGPPGSGKTMLARALSGILPPLTEQESLEVTRIASVAGTIDRDHPLITQRPFRSPHHTSSSAAIIGGGSRPRPGEITLAHRGVLFLDEFPEFPRAVLESLRQPLEDGFVIVSRAITSVRFPARFTLIASQNPCPCGYAGDSAIRCRCTAVMLERYRRRISGPLIDRIDLQLLVPRQSVDYLIADRSAETSAAVRERIAAARDRQHRRFLGSSAIVNADMSVSELRRWCDLDETSAQLLRTASAAMQLSGRAVHRVLRVSRTIADLAGSDTIQSEHVAEALQYRHRAT